jgi:Protein of unknown function (DUF3105)
MGKGERERERLRQERIEAEERDNRSGNNRMVVTYAIVSTVVLAVAVLVFVLVSGGGDSGESASAHINVNQEMGNTNGVQPDERAGVVPARTKVFDLDQAAKEAGCVVELKLKDEGKTHLPRNSPEPNYETNPATSGNHVEPPYQQADGAYSEEPKQFDVVHALEHGRLAIQYSPDLPEKVQLELKGLYDTMYGASLLFPNSKMPYEVAATTWTNLIGCKTYKGDITLDAIRAFGRETWGKYGGEPVEAFTFTGPTPGKPEEPSE